MREALDLFNFGVVVCDECHYLQNHRAARTKVTEQTSGSYNVISGSCQVYPVDVIMYFWHVIVTGVTSNSLVDLWQGAVFFVLQVDISNTTDLR